MPTARGGIAESAKERVRTRVDSRIRTGDKVPKRVRV